VKIAVDQPGGQKVFLDCTVSEPFGEGLRIATAVDVSERHQLEQQRRELLEREQAARAAAEQHSRTKDDFIAVLSHELRTPLSAIVGWVAVMQRRDPTPDQMKALESIERNVKAQARIISDILDVSRINSGKLRVERERVDPAQVVRNALTALQKDIGDRKIRVDLDLVDFAEAAWMDPNRFEQIFWNLMTNAIKFSPPGGTVLVRLRRDGNDLSLSVRDWGQGIDPEFLPRLFDRVSQSDAPGNRRHSGLGLGMAIVKHLVDLHGGNVKASSEGVGYGSMIEVNIPVFGTTFADEAAPEFDSNGNTGGGHTEADTSGRPLENLTVLVVEDDAGAAEMLSVVLADRGASVRIASDYDTALEALRMQWPDAMVSDIGLPGRDGYDLIRAVRGLPLPAGKQRLPAVALTAFARAEDRLRALQAGFDSHVTKPLKPHALVAALRSVVPARK
jgi:signal transduction histidine kinase/ActR/RegA family two-component response regulator